MLRALCVPNAASTGLVILQQHARKLLEVRVRLRLVREDRRRASRRCCAITVS